ncbi:uroporphyrinogen-III synthase [Brevundimonas sp.]|uniref:uroporphyrinogen-III synthase n=1 Tax=Brevundimonas sp. TaxID=1871086 RepID=UPI002ABA8A64|nr:uroporphyrinogen-III synthase [Brevundimonas sp.]MDZ4362247.1 uroporphyrinogen-III synthase [Brevundimonas sp.]
MARLRDRGAPCVWITRAQPGADRTAERVRAMGAVALVRPLLTIQRLAPAVDLADVAGLVFTSLNGVAAFAQLSTDRTLPVWAVGAATAQAARAAGFTLVVSADGDLSDLARLIRAQALAGQPLLHPRALEPSGDLAALVADHAPVRGLAVYAAVPTPEPVPEAFDVVLIHSPRAAQVLAARAGSGWGCRLAVAISPAAARPLKGLDLAGVHVADTPDEPALIAALGKAIGPV